MNKELISTIDIDAANEIYEFYRKYPNSKKSIRVEFSRELINKYSKLNINTICKIFGISRSYYYKNKYRILKKNNISDNTIYRYIKEIRKIEFCSRLGYKKITAKLNNDYRYQLRNKKISEYRVYRILSFHNDFSNSLKNQEYYNLTKSKMNPFLDLLDKRNRYTVDREFQILLTDSIVIQCKEYNLYYTVIIDLYGRRIIGDCLSETLDFKAYNSAFNEAIKHRKNNDSFTILHGDRGTLNTCKQVRRLAKDNRIRLSYSRKATPKDNAPNESFFASLKAELLNVNYLFSVKEMRYQIDRYLYFYHYERPHSSLGYLTPMGFINK